MRRVGLKRSLPEQPSSSQLHIAQSSPEPSPKRPRIESQQSGGLRGIIQAIQSFMAGVWRRFRGQQRPDTEDDTDSVDSFESCIQELPSRPKGSSRRKEIFRPPPTHLPRVPQRKPKPSNTRRSTSQARAPEPAAVKSLSLPSASNNAPPHFSTPTTIPLSSTPHNQSRPLLFSASLSRVGNRHRPHPSWAATPTSTSKPFSSERNPIAGNTPMAGKTPMVRKTPTVGTTPSKSFLQSSKTLASPTPEDILGTFPEDILRKAPDSVVSPPESIGPVSPRSPLMSQTSVGREDMNELEKWLGELKMSVNDNQAQRELQVELLQKKLLASQAGRRQIEEARVNRLKSLLTPRKTETPRLNFDISPDQEKQVLRGTNGGPASENLVTGFNITLSRGDLCTLVGLNWLNDNVVNFYFNMIRAAHPKIHVMSSFFYPKLRQSGYSSIRRWTKKVDIFSMEKVFFPIHLGMHWCLAVADLTSSKLSYYDSLGAGDKGCLRALRDYLGEESQTKRSVALDLSSWEMHNCKDIPNQLNGSDCGVFMCMYARHIAAGLPFSFTQTDFPKIRQHMIVEIMDKTLQGEP